MNYKHLVANNVLSSLIVMPSSPIGVSENHSINQMQQTRKPNLKKIGEQLTINSLRNPIGPSSQRTS